MLDPVAGPRAPEAFIGDLLGVRTPEEQAFARRLLLALDKAVPDLVPRALEHPFQAEIGQGLVALPGLLGDAEAGPEDRRTAALDAIARIAEREPLTGETMAGLRRLLAQAASPAVASVAARALATGRDPEFLREQRNFLASEDLAQLRVSARLLGYGKDPAAAPILIDLLRLDRMAVADVVLWALGEIGAEAAVPQLHAFLDRGILPTHVLSALGQIGARASVMAVMPALLEGAQGTREAAAEALARIIQKQEGRLGDRDLGRSVLEALGKIVSTDTSKRVRFWAMLGYAGLGGHLEPKAILHALGGGLTEHDLEGVAQFMTRRRPIPKK